jgi:transcriptional regulator with XRE-family HTH domain
MFYSERTGTVFSETETLGAMTRRVTPEKPLVPRFPNRIRELRKARGWSLEQLAEAVHRSPDNVSKKERGERRLRLEEMPLYASALDCSVADLLPGEASLSQREKTLLAYFGAMTPDQQDQLLKFATFLANGQARDVG